MVNMSYCRHYNTRLALSECIEDAQEHIDGVAECAVSDEEVWAFRKMVGEFYDFLNEAGLLNEFGELDEEKLDEVCEQMATVAE